MSGKPDLGECLSLDVDSLPSAVYLSPVETPPNKIIAILCLVHLESDKLRFFTVPAQNTSEVHLYTLHHWYIYISVLYSKSKKKLYQLISGTL